MAALRNDTLIVYSRHAFYPVHWLAVEEIARRYAVRVVVLAGLQAELPSVHVAHGEADPRPASRLPIEIRHMPAGSRRKRLSWLAREVRAACPDAIWVQEEPTDPFLLELLALYRFRERPRIVTAVCENIFPPPSWPERVTRRLLWPRLDHLLAVAGPSLEGIRVAGMPESVAASTLVAGGLEPEGAVAPMALPFDGGGTFVVGFAGRIVEEKGWKVLVEAIDDVPDTQLVFAGDGRQVDELRAVCFSAERMHYVGLLPKGELWSFYGALDCLAVPSLTTPRWKEQSASTLVDGLCMGLPIVASASGGIADMMGSAGLLVPEGDTGALREALTRVRDDERLRAELGSCGKDRFRREFAIPAYADKIAAALNLHVRSVALDA